MRLACLILKTYLLLVFIFNKSYFVLSSLSAKYRKVLFQQVCYSSSDKSALISLEAFCMRNVWLHASWIYVRHAISVINSVINRNATSDSPSLCLYAYVILCSINVYVIYLFGQLSRCFTCSWAVVNRLFLLYHLLLVLSPSFQVAIRCFVRGVSSLCKFADGAVVVLRFSCQTEIFNAVCSVHTRSPVDV